MAGRSKLIQRIKDKFALMVSIPKNDPDMAAAAQEGGADGIKVHLNVHHYASGTHFGTWDEEKEAIQKILGAVDIPVGLLPGANHWATAEEIREAREMGIDFLDAFAHDMPLYLWEIKDLGRMLAVNTHYMPEFIRALGLFGTDLVEATVLPQQEYGNPLTIKDLTVYHWLSNTISRPVIVPTQKKVRPEEVGFLNKAGAAGVVIGAVVTGKTSEGVLKTTKSFREAIDKMT